MPLLRKGLLGTVLVLWMASAGAVEERASTPCPEPACVELESAEGLLRLGVALGQPANAETMDASAGAGPGAASRPAFPLSVVAVLFGLVGVVALARRRMGS
jgi:hypothetical protein